MSLFPLFVRSLGGDMLTVSHLWVVMVILEIPLVAYSGAWFARLGPRVLLATGISSRRDSLDRLGARHRRQRDLRGAGAARRHRRRLDDRRALLRRRGRAGSAPLNRARRALDGRREPRRHSLEPHHRPLDRARRPARACSCRRRWRAPAALGCCRCSSPAPPTPPCPTPFSASPSPPPSPSPRVQAPISRPREIRAWPIFTGRFQKSRERVFERGTSSDELGELDEVSAAAPKRERTRQSVAARVERHETMLALGSLLDHAHVVVAAGDARELDLHVVLVRPERRHRSVGADARTVEQAARGVLALLHCVRPVLDAHRRLEERIQPARAVACGDYVLGGSCTGRVADDAVVDLRARSSRASGSPARLRRRARRRRPARDRRRSAPRLRRASSPRRRRLRSRSEDRRRARDATSRRLHPCEARARERAAPRVARPP